jgi:hypothetical protein
MYFFIIFFTNKSPSILRHRNFTSMSLQLLFLYGEGLEI